MTAEADPVVSAQVLLKTAGGKMPRDADLTADRISAIIPDRATVEKVTSACSRAGFEVGPVVGLSFSLTGRQSLFDSFFGMSGAGSRPGDVSLDRLPLGLRSAIAAITFPPPPDFGPSRYSSS